MKKIIEVLLFSFVLISLGLSQTAIQISSQNFNHENVISSVVRTTSNQLLLFWFDNDLKKLYISRSNDDGNTWSSAQQILTNYQFSEDTVLELNSIVTSNSDIMLEFKQKSSYGLSYYSISTNNGVTWTEPTHINFSTALNNLRAFNSSLGKLSNGTIVFCFNYLTPSTTNPKGIYISKFVNNSWTNKQVIDSTGIWGFLFSPSPNKEMVIFADSNFNKTDLYFRTSTDSGNSWSSRQILLTTPNSKSRPRVVKSDNGWIYVFYEELIPTSFNGFYQREIFYVKSNDSGISWSSPVRVTNYPGNDYFLSVTSTSINIPVLTFTSSRNFQLGNNKTQIYLLKEAESISPPVLIYNNPIPDTASYGSSLNIMAFVEDNNQIEYVNLLVNNITGMDTIQMFDDGFHQDSLAGDKIFGCNLSNLEIGANYLYVSMKNINQLQNTFFIGLIVVPQNYVSNNYLIELNKIKLPLTNDGILADANVNGIEGMYYDNKKVLFSGGFYLAGKNGNQWWANGIASASRIQDYLPGLPGFPDDPRNILYVVKSSDPPFGNSWQSWSDAVLLGANFYDGNNDGNYSPLDLNQNGQWDSNEDKPDILGDLTIWCTYNDGKLPYFRRFSDTEPMGIIIQQTIFGIKPSSDHPADNMFFIRYRLINNNTVSFEFDSVYFSIWMDPDIGSEYSAYMDDLAACDTLLNSGYAYNDGDDSDWGINPPSIATTLLQGPVVYIPGETFIDNNNNGVYDPGIDLPIDTAVVKKGPLLGVEEFPGGRNLGMNNFKHYMQSHFVLGDPATSQELVNYIRGYDRFGNLIDPCNWLYGVVNGINCNEVNPLFLYSGDPVTNSGWINIAPADQRTVNNVGPFSLKSGQPIDIWVAYVLGRGNNALNSITIMKENIQYSIEAYNNNFANLPISVENNNNIPMNYILYQNYPNPFNLGTMITFSIASKSFVFLKVYDILGREVSTLVSEELPAGTYSRQWSAVDLPSGVYFYRLQAGWFTDTRKLILQR